MPIGNIEAFDRTTGNWKLYIERLEQYFLVNDIKEYLKVPTLIALMGGTSYELLITLCAPQKPSTMTFIDVVKTMSDHLYPKPCILAERYKFRQRKQYNGETISEYVADLKKLAMKCAFKTRLDENLRDQLVCGIHCETTRKRLFAKNSLDFRTALTIAHSLETGDGPTSDCKSDDEGSISRPEFKEDFALTLKLGASDGSSTKFNSDEDDYLTNFVTLGNTISQGKVSAGPNIQCNNDGEVEISLSDYKDDLVIAHGLEANGGQSRDHSTEDAVPMCHSVKSGSGDEGTPKFKRSKVKPWIYVDKFINLKKAEEFLDKENTWSRSSTYITKDGPKRFYRCNKNNEAEENDGGN
nr:uncharacterized protein LOC117984074 [Maniola hyperantus]